MLCSNVAHCWENPLLSLSQCVKLSNTYMEFIIFHLQEHPHCLLQYHYLMTALKLYYTQTQKHSCEPNKLCKGIGHLGELTQTALFRRRTLQMCARRLSVIFGLVGEKGNSSTAFKV